MTLNKFAIIIEIKDTKFSSFLVVRKVTATGFEITFKVINKTNRRNTIYSEIRDELSDFKNDMDQRTIQWASESDSVRETTDQRPDRWQQEYTGGGRVSKKLRFLLR